MKLPEMRDVIAYVAALTILPAALFTAAWITDHYRVDAGVCLLVFFVGICLATVFSKMACDQAEARQFKERYERRAAEQRAREAMRPKEVYTPKRFPIRKAGDGIFPRHRNNDRPPVGY